MHLPRLASVALVAVATMITTAGLSHAMSDAAPLPQAAVAASAAPVDPDDNDLQALDEDGEPMHANGVDEPEAQILDREPEMVAAQLPDRAVFNNPRTGGREIVEYVSSLVTRTPRGAYIRVAMYNFKDTALARQLVAAKAAGAHVQVVVHKGTPAALGVLDDLGRYSTAAGTSWYVKCNAGCIGPKATAIMHNKFFLFSQTAGTSNVLVESSANLTVHNADQFYNNAVSLSGHTAVYNSFVAYFADLASQRKDANYYRTVVGPNRGGVKPKSYFFPRAGTDKSTDVVYSTLENVQCTGNSTVGTKDTHRTIIRVAMWNITRDNIAAKLRELAGQKCWIEITYTELQDVIREKGLLNHDRIILRHLPKPYIVHSKYMTIEGKYDNVPDQKLVFTGSHNWTNAALRTNDESMMKINSDRLHEQYRLNFNEIRKYAVVG